MMRAGNELMKMLREDMELSQEQLGEHLHMSQRTISRVETGKRNLGIWEYMALMQMAGTPTEDLSPLFLDSGELKDYNAYNELRKLLRDRKYAEVREMLPDFEKNLASKQTFILQFITFARIISDEEIPPEQAIEKLYEALSMSIKNFDHERIAKYRYTYFEILIITGIGMKLDAVGKVDCAIALCKALIESRGNALATEEDKAALYPALMYNLSVSLGKAGKYAEALSYCEDAHGISIKYSNFRLVPKIIYYMAYYNYMLGEEERVYRTLYARAYHAAYALGDRKTAEIIKEEAKKIGLEDL